MGNGVVFSLGLDNDFGTYDIYKSTNGGADWLYLKQLFGLENDDTNKYISLQEKQHLLSYIDQKGIVDIMVSDDFADTWNPIFTVNKSTPGWLYPKFTSISYMGNGRLIGVVAEGFTDENIFFKGMITSGDYGKSWELVSSKEILFSDYDGENIMIGVTTNDPDLVGVINTVNLF